MRLEGRCLFSCLKKIALKFTRAALLAATLLFPAHNALALPEIMPLEQVKSGMSGLAYTVIDGSGTIESFNVDIIGLMDNGKGSNKMLMAKASGAVIEKTGGVLQGMSGSPVYIDGKLVGALAAALKEMSPYTFFITPIETMLPMWSMPDPKALNKYQQVDIKNVKTEEKSPSDDGKNKDKKINDNNLKSTVKKSEDKKSEKIEEIKNETPEIENKSLDKIYIDGFDEKGLQFLSRHFPLENLDVNQTSSSPNSINYNAKLEPGSAVGVAVVYGDFSVGATGTVTAVEGNKILGFGHSFTHAGNVNFFMTDASVIGTISGESGTGVKVSNIGNIIGRINQDRDAGVAGIIGKFPSVVPITVKIFDKSLGKKETYNASIAYNENLIPKLGAAIAYTALSKTADSLAESTVDIDFAIKTNAIKSGKIERSNTFYNNTDVGQVAILELMQALNLVCSNTAAESDIFSINVDMTLDNERRTASLISAVPEKVKVKPGETVNITVTLQPYRKAAEKLIVPYTVPVTMRPGTLTLNIHGGALVPATTAAEALANAGLITSVESNDIAKNYSDKINELINAGKNNQIVVEPGTPAEPKSERELKREIARAKKAQEKAVKLAKNDKNKKSEPKDSKVSTNYIIDNVIRTTIDVEKI